MHLSSYYYLYINKHQFGFDVLEMSIKVIVSINKNDFIVIFLDHVYAIGISLSLPF